MFTTKSRRKLGDIPYAVALRKITGIKLSPLSLRSSDSDLTLDYVNSQTQKVLSHDILTIGFARRAAEYKRARLIFSDLERLKSIGTNKLQIIFAGKAHPKDSLGKSIIKSVIEDANKLFGSIKIVYLENYNIWLQWFFYR